MTIMEHIFRTVHLFLIKTRWKTELITISQYLEMTIIFV